MKVLFVSAFDPAPVGNGGNHRAYQVRHDLGRAVGEDNLVIVSYVDWRRARSVAAQHASPASPRLPAIARRLARQWRAAMQRVRRRHRSALHGRIETQMCGPDFTAHFDTLVEATPDAALCVIEHPSFVRLAPLNARRGIDTVACPQNVESLDAAARRGDPDAGARAARELGAEYRLLAACAARLFMSAAEAQLCEGLGLTSEVYTYLPVGEIRQACMRTAERRSTIPQDGPLVLLGSGSHHTTRSAIEWFLGNAARSGLPPPTSVVVVGMRTEELTASATGVTGLEFRGWVAQDELEALLERAPAVLVTQQTGFGTLTKLPELALAGIPVIASRHAVRAYGGVPGVTGLGDDWEEWRAAMAAAARGAAPGGAEAYLAWERQQGDVLVENVLRVLGRRTRRGFGREQA
jgi:hypothetical protein